MLFVFLNIIIFNGEVRIFDVRECIVRERVRWGWGGGGSGADYPNLTSGIPRKGYVCQSVVEFDTSQSNSLPPSRPLTEIQLVRNTI
jgi:hypothetical protein